MKREAFESNRLDKSNLLVIILRCLESHYIDILKAVEFKGANMIMKG